MYLGKVFVGLYAEILVCFLKDERTCEWATDAARGLSLIFWSWKQPGPSPPVMAQISGSHCHCMWGSMQSSLRTLDHELDCTYTSSNLHMNKPLFTMCCLPAFLVGGERSGAKVGRGGPRERAVPSFSAAALSSADLLGDGSWRWGWGGTSLGLQTLHSADHRSFLLGPQSWSRADKGDS